MPRKPSKSTKPPRHNLGEAKPQSGSLYREVKAIGVIVVGILLLLSVFAPNALGRVGMFIHNFLLGIMGFGAFFMPIVLIGGAGCMLFSKKIQLPWALGSGLFTAVLTLLHVFNRPDGLLVYGMTGAQRLGVVFRGTLYDGGEEIISRGMGGGIYGALFGDMLDAVIGRVGSIIVLLALIIIFLLLLTGRSFAYLMRKGYYQSRDALERRRERIEAERAEEEERERERINALPPLPEREKDEPPEERGLPAIEYDDEEFTEAYDLPEVRLLQEELKEAAAPPPPKTPLFAQRRMGADGEKPRSRGEIVLFPEKKPPAPDEDNGGITLRGLVDGAAHDPAHAPPPWEDDNFGDEHEAHHDGTAVLPYEASYEDYQMPPLDLLAQFEAPDNSLETRSQILANSRTLEDTLRSFKIEAKVVAVSVGPSVTRYDIAPGAGVKVSSIANLSNDLALALAAQGIRIEAPIPGKSAVGIEIPNKEPQPVFLRDIIECEKFTNYPSNLAFAVGKDIAGEPVVTDIARMPHLLIAGATGSGKSVCINTLITSILYTARPDEVKLLMIDPKVVELSVYNGIPHLLIPVVTDPKKASGALSWAVAEMENRYNLFADTGNRDLKGYNRYLVENFEPPLPQIVIIIDELADLMMAAKGEVEESICRLAQKARAAGLHLIVATQRPSVDVITGLIKANIPSRLAFAVSSGIDSRTVLDMYGAEKLLGKGDMLFSPLGQSKPIRVQGCFISEKEVEGIVNFLRAQAQPTHTEEMIEQVTSPAARIASSVSGELDEFFHEAVEFLLTKGKASTSVLQRQFRIGYNRASRLMEDLEKRGIVGPEDGVKPRKLLITRSEYLEVYRNGE